MSAALGMCRATSVCKHAYDALWSQSICVQAVGPPSYCSSHPSMFLSIPQQVNAYIASIMLLIASRCQDAEPCWEQAKPNHMCCYCELCQAHEQGIVTGLGAGSCTAKCSNLFSYSSSNSQTAHWTLPVVVPLQSQLCSMGPGR